ncbi:MAG: carboxypeptidase-like regulatory domain-containing protein [Chitinophagaceae bacterium]|nr:carboxypeptidase-like regulatory domain-containing protein [Chitinophagaceae bacterium]
MQRKFFFVLFILLLPFFSLAQSIAITGNIYDAVTKAPLAFVSVTLKGTNTGTVTDIDGHFAIDKLPANALLVISYVGYKTKEYRLEKTGTAVSVFIEPADGQLESVIVSTNENPAHRIIKLLQRNKKRNDPEHQPAFKYNAYTIAALASGDRFWNMNRSDSSKQKNPVPQMQQMDKQMDKLVKTSKDKDTNSLGSKLGKRFKENYLMLTESYTERIYKFPGQTKETVLATKFSGLKNATFGVTTDNFQPFGFYKDYLVMNNVSFVSPVIEGSINLYKFRLKERIPHEKDTTYIISFEPRAGKNFKGLKGLIYINSDGYAIENIIASPSDEKGMIFTFRLQQKYERVKGKWFPAQLNSTLSQKDLRTDSVLLFWDCRSYITNIDFSKTFTKANFSDVKLEYHPQAGKRADTTWRIMRTDSLSEKGKITYETYEMLPAKYRNMIEKVNKAFQILSLEGIPLGKVDIPFKYILSGINKYESFRIGAGLQTNSLFSKWFSAGGFAGYGLRDRAFKYGGNLQFNLQQRTNTVLRFDYSRDITEPGNVDYFVRNGSVFSNQSLRNFQRSRFDSVEQFKINFSTKIRPSIQTDIWLMNETRNPAKYEYEFVNNGSNIRSFKNTELGIGFRLTKGESFTRMGRAKLRTKPATTELLFQISKGLKNVFNGDLDYTRIAIRFNHSFQFKKLGKTSFRLEAGQVWGDVPYSYLFNARATKAGRLSVYVPDHFQTVGLYEFAASSTANLFVEHNFGNLLFKPKNISFRPEIFVIQNISYGNLQQTASHKLLTFKVPGKGLFESGLMIKNIYRRSLYSLVYIGLGGGVFYRYGYYALPKASDNWAFKWGFSISF